MLYISGANKSLVIALTKETTKKPATYAVFSVEHVDKVTIETGKEKKTVSLFDDSGITYHETHKSLAVLLDKAIYNGPYSPSVLLAKGYISEEGFGVIARNVVSQEAHDRGITLEESFDYSGALKAIIGKRSYGKENVLSLPASPEKIK